nr:MAG TPA: hypothetical protein [Caudoviricetes sp.]
MKARLFFDSQSKGGGKCATEKGTQTGQQTLR